MKTLLINFILKKGRNTENSRTPLYLRVNINSTIFEMSTKLKLQPENWDSKRQFIKGKTEEVKTQNMYLSDLKAKVHREFNLLYENKEKFTINELKSALLGKKPNAKTLIEVFEENNKLMQKESGHKYVENTVERYEISISRLKEFLKADIAGETILIEDIDFKFMMRYENFLTTKYHCSHNTTMKYLKHLKKVINQAIKFGYLKSNPFTGYVTAYKETNRGYLTNDELDTLKSKTFRLQRLTETRDIFLFTCYTGISYSDLKKLSNNNIQTMADGQKIIILERNKTGIRAAVPVLNEAQEIINKYKEHPVCIAKKILLPIISNQKLNFYLQEIAELCEINTHITMHLGRHTFATTVTLSNGVPLETVQKMLGHKYIQTTLIYGKVIDTKIADDMKVLAVKLLKKDENEVAEK